MKHTSKIGGNAKTADANAENQNNISYVVRLEIRHFDENRNCTMLVDEQKPFKGKRAIDCRKEAFKYAYQLTLDANIQGKLCSNYLDTPAEAFEKGMKNFTAISVEIDCVDEISGERTTISEADFFNDPDDLLDDCEAELMWYNEYCYDTDDNKITVEDKFGDPHQILDFGTIVVKRKNSFNRYFFQSPMSDFEKWKVIYVVSYHQFSSKADTLSFPEEQFAEFIDPNPLVARRRAFEFALSVNTYPDKRPINYVPEPYRDIYQLPISHSLKSVDTLRWCRISLAEFGAPGFIDIYREGNNQHSAPYLAYECKLLKNLGYAKDADMVTVLDEDGVSYEILREDNCLQEYNKAV